MKHPLNICEKKPVWTHILLTVYVATVLGVTLVGFMPILGYGEPDDTSLEVVPTPIYKSVGDTFDVNVTLYNVTDLMAFEYKFQWNSTLLNSTGYTKVDYVNDLGWGMNFQAKDALTAGQHWFAVSALLDPSTTSFNGSVSLASYTFEVVGSGTCVLDILDEKLGNSSALQIPRTVVDGSFGEDSSPPVIGDPSRMPSGDVQPSEAVKVSVNVTDDESGVKNVTLSYTITNGTSWADVEMVYNSTSSVFEATIPGQPAFTWVKFNITAYDNAENSATRDGAGEFFVYQVVPELPTWTSILIVLVTVTAFIAVYERRLRKTQIR